MLINGEYWKCGKICHPLLTPHNVYKDKWRDYKSNISQEKF